MSPNIPVFTKVVGMAIDCYADPEPGLMLRILVSRGMVPTMGVGEDYNHLP